MPLSILPFLNYYYFKMSWYIRKISPQVLLHNCLFSLCSSIVLESFSSSKKILVRFYWNIEMNLFTNLEIIHIISILTFYCMQYLLHIFSSFYWLSIKFYNFLHKSLQHLLVDLFLLLYILVSTLHAIFFKLYFQFFF